MVTAQPGNKAEVFTKPDCRFHGSVEHHALGHARAYAQLPAQADPHQGFALGGRGQVLLPLA